MTKAGRFAHEAVSFDPREGRLYLTEDNFGFPSGFYRYTPKTNPMTSGRLDNEGTLQMLAVKGQPKAHLEASQAKGATYSVVWVDIDDPDPTFPYTPGSGRADEERRRPRVRRRPGPCPGGGRLLPSRGTGVRQRRRLLHLHPRWRRRRPAPDTATGYGNGFGQVWAYDTRSEKLRLVYQSPGKQTFDFPDNITVSDRGTLVVCEDNNEDNYVRGLNKGGQLLDIALNRASNANGTPRFDDEFAGSTFSPDGSTLFVNIQASAGLTFAIWGPWHTIGV